MRQILTQILLLFSVVSLGQDLSSIKVSVPNKTDEVYIVGNQECLGNWQPDMVKMNKISDYEREILLNLNFPAEFKFTRGSWESEAVITKLSGQPNFVLKEKPTKQQHYTIHGWTDEINKFSTFSEFEIIEIKSKILNQKRKIYVALPEDYDENINYPVVYVTDANFLKIFEIVVQTLRQQANFSNFPKCIVVGIYINVRNRNNELDIEYKINGQKFKDYIFKEVVPFVDKNYSVSSFKAIYGHSNGAEYNHYLMFEKDNPFDAFINISENLIDLKNGQFEIIESKYIDFLNNNKKPIKYFVASGKYDDPGRYPSGIKIENIIKNHPTKNLDFSHKVYRSWHIDLIASSILDAFQFIFSDYQDYGLFENMTKDKNFDFQKTKGNYLKQNEKFIYPYFENDASYEIIYNIVMGSKNPKILKQYLESEDKNNENYNFYVRAILFYEIGDLSTALFYLDKMVKTNDAMSVKGLVYSEGKLYIEIYKTADKLNLGYKNLEVLQKKNPRLKEEIGRIKKKIR